jgi:(p)ppGpp synthase/HD superfamily hydrolase
VSLRFGDEVAQLVDGVTKLNNLELSSVENAQAENFRKLLMAMSKDLASFWSSSRTGCTTCARSSTSR